VTDLLAARLVRDIPDFPTPGVTFKDITPVLADSAALQEIIDRFAEWATACSPAVVVGIESRGFLFGVPLALALGVGFVPIRKAGKLPRETWQREYALEYGAGVLEMHRDALRPGQRVLLIDDLLATGGTALAAAHLIERGGGHVAGIGFLLELRTFNGRAALAEYDTHALLSCE